MVDIAYWFTVRLITRFYWKGTLQDPENLPVSGPAVFVANHLGPIGPIGTVCALPFRFYPWIIADMVDRNLAANYLRIDFVEPTLKLKFPVSMWTARAIALISVPFLRYLGCIPVDRPVYENLQETLRASISLLKDEKCVLIFPEEPNLELDPLTNMRPFLKGFTRLGELYFIETGKRLRFYPIAVHASKNVCVGKPIAFNPDHQRALERQRLKELLENQIKEMYLKMGMDRPASS